MGGSASCVYLAVGTSFGGTSDRGRPGPMVPCRKLDKGGDVSSKAVFAQNAPNTDNTDHLGRHFGTEPPRLAKPIDRQVV
jgi:hypothetical protein